MIGNRVVSLRRLCGYILLLPAFVLLYFPAEGSGSVMAAQAQETEAWDTSGFLTVVEDEPDTVDFQCTTIHYTIAQNVFDRLVEITKKSGVFQEVITARAGSIISSHCGPETIGFTYQKKA